jgi:antitoxin component of RelBE/YafQ-DinJ toxin-antitoxin module
MDAMVTARMSQGKKNAGNSVLRELGTNPSKLINDLFDYVIKTKQLPLLVEERNQARYSIQEAQAFIDSIPVTYADEFLSMSDDQIKQERLISKGIVEPGYFE